MKAKKKISLLKKIGLAVAGLITLVVILIVIGIVLAPDYTKKKTPAGFPINSDLAAVGCRQREMVFRAGAQPGPRTGLRSRGE
jgi:hypothetical protein